VLALLPLSAAGDADRIGDASSLSVGQERAVTMPTEAAQSTKNTSDLLRRFKELNTSIKSHAELEPEERNLRVLLPPEPRSSLTVLSLARLSKRDMVSSAMWCAAMH
jgi:hypothetical protein